MTLTSIRVILAALSERACRSDMQLSCSRTGNRSPTWGLPQALRLTALGRGPLVPGRRKTVERQPVGHSRRATVCTAEHLLGTRQHAGDQELKTAPHKVWDAVCAG